MLIDCLWMESRCPAALNDSHLSYVVFTPTLDLASMAGLKVGSWCPLRCVWLGSRYARGMGFRIIASSISALKPARSTVTGPGTAGGEAGSAQMPHDHLHGVVE